MTEGYWKDWLPAMLRTWAHDYSRACNAGHIVKNEKGDEAWHWDSWPPTTMLGKIKLEGTGAAHSKGGQHFAEVYSRDGLLVRRAMEGLRYDPRRVIYAIYLCYRMTHPERFAILGLAKTTYWELHAEAHVWIASGISRIQGSPDYESENRPDYRPSIKAAFKALGDTPIALSA